MRKAPKIKRHTVGLVSEANGESAEPPRNVPIKEVYTKEGLQIIVKSPSHCTSPREKAREDTLAPHQFESMPCRNPEPLARNEEKLRDTATVYVSLADTFYPKELE